MRQRLQIAEKKRRFSMRPPYLLRAFDLSLSAYTRRSLLASNGSLKMVKLVLHVRMMLEPRARVSSMLHVSRALQLHMEIGPFYPGTTAA
jgi:hypothetical protein